MLTLSNSRDSDEAGGVTKEKEGVHQRKKHGDAALRYYDTKMLKY